MTSIELFILAKSDLFLDGLQRILMDSDQINVCHTCDDVETGIEQLNNCNTDVLLLQAALIKPPFDFFLNKLRTNNPDLKILIFGQSLDNDFLLNIIRSGANGYINSNMSAQHLIDAVNYIHEGKMWAERTILEQLAQDALDMENLLENIAMEKTMMLSEILTKREAQVFQWVLKGLSTKEIADQIYLSEQSVKLHLGKLFKKFEVTNRPQLILSAFEKVSPVNNLIPLIQMTLEKKTLGHKHKK